MANTKNSARRQAAALQASYQLDAMIDMLGRESRYDSFDLLVKASLPRMHELTSVVMSALGNDVGRKTSEMEMAVNLEAEEHD